METVRSLIALRKEEPLMRSRDFHFPEKFDNPRVIDFIKVEDENNYLEVILNCSEESVCAPQEGDIRFARHYKNDSLATNGVLIQKIQK